MLHCQQKDRIGIISPECSPFVAVKRVLPQVNKACECAYGIYPELEIYGSKTVTIPYIANHLDYILRELLKNSFRATVEEARRRSGTSFPTLPKVTVLIAPGVEHVTLRISDSGGGIPHEILHKIWRYGFSTVKKDPGDVQVGRSDPVLIQSEITRIAGHGFGLPLSRLYAKHFGGDLSLKVLGGYGTDAHLRLDKTGSAVEAFEC
eukprot:TRINITY_DN11399_c1_g1_i2.p1 TRINITY_DN11399_c1_g1~~TRINITY_DN11399_c1_g1_i2.p1  ORF type:complete len:206 (-),score=34.55 TRINITY_DN11399_c1_g1_i2:116-733(-)